MVRSIFLSSRFSSASVMTVAVSLLRNCKAASPSLTLTFPPLCFGSTMVCSFSDILISRGGLRMDVQIPCTNMSLKGCTYFLIYNIQSIHIATLLLVVQSSLRGFPLFPPPKSLIFHAAASPVQQWKESLHPECIRYLSYRLPTQLLSVVIGVNDQMLVRPSAGPSAASCRSQIVGLSAPPNHPAFATVDWGVRCNVAGE